MQNNTLPFWTDKLQGGFPLFAEGQTGSLHLPNIVIFKLFEFIPAYNLLIISSLFFLSFATYLFLITLGTFRFLALLLALTFTFSGVITYRLVHLNLLQTVSIGLFLFYTVTKWRNSPGLWQTTSTIFFMTQMIFAGHFQAAFIVLLGLVFWFIFLTFSDRERVGKKKKILGFVGMILSSLILTLPQLLPTYILSTYASRSALGGYLTATSYSLPFKHLISFVLPYPFGNPQDGTYPFMLSTWGIFWENTPHVGALFCICTLSLFFILLLKKEIRKKTYGYFFLCAIFLLFALGHNSPFYFIFDIFPFSAFRTPPKYLLIAVFFLIVFSYLLIKKYLVSYASEGIKILIYTALIINIIILLFYANKYHLFENAILVMQKPYIASFMDKSLKYITLGYGKEWNKAYVEGWSKSGSIQRYRTMNNFLIPNSNLIYGLSVYDVNTGGLKLRRPEYLRTLIETALEYEATRSAHILLDLVGITRVILPSQIGMDGLEVTGNLKAKTNNFFVYSYHTSKPQTFYVPQRLRKIEYTSELADSLENDWLSTTSALIESSESPDRLGTISTLSTIDSDTYSNVVVDADQRSLIVFRKNIYPEWIVMVDGKSADPERINLVHMGVWVPDGRHKITLYYYPKYFVIGTAISLSYLIFLFFYLRKYYSL